MSLFGTDTRVCHVGLSIVWTGIVPFVGVVEKKFLFSNWLKGLLCSTPRHSFQPLGRCTAELEGLLFQGHGGCFRTGLGPGPGSTSLGGEAGTRSGSGSRRPWSLAWTPVLALCSSSRREGGRRPFALPSTLFFQGAGFWLISPKRRLLRPCLLSSVVLSRYVCNVRRDVGVGRGVLLGSRAGPWPPPPCPSFYYIHHCYVCL